MDNNLTDKIELKEKLLQLYRRHKLKFIVFFVIIIIIIAAFIYFKEVEKKRNNLSSELYIQAGIYLSLDNKVKSKDLYEKIILSKNKFYSILSLNAILEKNLVKDKNKILEYFEIVEKLNLNKTQKDLITFKKALFLMKENNFKESEELIKKLIDTNSEFKELAEEIIDK